MRAMTSRRCSTVSGGEITTPWRPCSPGIGTVCATIVPGWYSGRTPHMHFMVRSVSATGALTNRVPSQLFFDPTVINAIYTGAAAYSARGTPDTTNAADMVYNTRTTSGTIAGP